MYRNNYDNVIITTNRNDNNQQLKHYLPLNEKKPDNLVNLKQLQNLKPFYENTLINQNINKITDHREQLEKNQLRKSQCKYFPKGLPKQPSKQLQHQRNHSDYQLNISNAYNNKATNSKQIGLYYNPQQQTQLPQKYLKSFQNTSIQQLSIIEQINQKIQIMGQKINKNQQKIKSLQSNIENNNLIETIEKQCRRIIISEREQEIKIKGNIEDSFKTMQKNMKQYLHNYLESAQTKIDAWRQEILKSSKFADLQFKFESIEFQIKDLNNCIKIDLAKYTHQNAEKYTKMLKQQVDSIRNQFEKKIHQTFSQLHQIATVNITNSSNTDLFRSKRIFKAFPIKITHNETIKIQKQGDNLSINNNCRIVNLSQVQYYLDNEGYLLDDNQCYLVDSNGKTVKLGQQQLKILRQLEVII